MLLVVLRWVCGVGAEGLGPPAPATVVVVTCSAHYLDFFDNWVRWLERSVGGAASDDVGIVAIAEDAATFPALSAWAGEAVEGQYRRAVRGDDAPPLVGGLDFEGANFARLMSRRGAHLAAALEALRADRRWRDDPRSRMIFSDLDALWLRDPRPLVAGGALRGRCDAWAQTQHRERGLLNPGFLALGPTDGALELLTDWARRLAAYDAPTRNLPVFNAAVDGLRDAVTVCALPPDVVASAKRTLRRETWRVGDGNVAVLHANWLDGRDAKRAALRRAGAWLAPDDATDPLAAAPSGWAAPGDAPPAPPDIPPTGKPPPRRRRAPRRRVDQPTLR